MRIRLLCLILFIATGFARSQDLQIQQLPSQGMIVGQAYTLPLQATGGTAPYAWHLVQGDMPPGLKLHPHTGKITGSPTVPGDYHFTIGASDASIPKLNAQRDLVIHVIAGLEVDWKEPPAAHGNSISGSAVVSNQTGVDFDLTVVVVAVNEIGRATALGYQHFKLPAQSSSPVIPFGSSPGNGTYYVRVDAIAHQSSHHYVYRANKQTSEPIKVTQF
jgi:hypothetical protein